MKKRGKAQKRSSIQTYDIFWVGKKMVKKNSKKNAKKISKKEIKKRYHEVFFDTVKESFRSLGKPAIISAVVDSLAFALVFLTFFIWNRAIFALMEPVKHLDPETVLAMAETPALDSALVSLQALMRGMIIYSIIAAIVILLVVSASRWIIWNITYKGSIFKDKIRGYLRFLLLSLSMFVIALPFYAYAVFGIMRYTGMGLEDDNLRFWSGLFLVFIMVALHFRMCAVHQHFSTKQKILTSVSRSIKAGFWKIHYLIPAYALLLVPIVLLFMLWSRVLLGDFLLFAHVATVVIVLAWGRGFLREVFDKVC
jgi:hypothetical protein